MNKDDSIVVPVVYLPQGEKQAASNLLLYLKALTLPKVKLNVILLTQEGGDHGLDRHFKVRLVPIAFDGVSRSINATGLAQAVLEASESIASEIGGKVRLWIFTRFFPVGVYEALHEEFSKELWSLSGQINSLHPWTPSAAEIEHESFDHKRPLLHLDPSDLEFTKLLLDEEERRAIRRALRTPGSVLITGARGTGKTLLARHIHFHASATTRGEFIEVNFAALPSTLVEGELFGSVGGTATGVEERMGLLEAAHLGTLFFDEIGETPKSIQAKLLRVIESRSGPIRFRRLGDRRDREVEVRILAATNLSESEIRKRVRRDLLARFSIRIHLKGIYDKLGDPLEYFINQAIICPTSGRSAYLRS